MKDIAKHPFFNPAVIAAIITGLFGVITPIVVEHYKHHKAPEVNAQPATQNIVPVSEPYQDPYYDPYYDPYAETHEDTSYENPDVCLDLINVPSGYYDYYLDPNSGCYFYYYYNDYDNWGNVITRDCYYNYDEITGELLYSNCPY